MSGLPLATPSTPIIPSSQSPAGILRMPSSTLPHPSTRNNSLTSISQSTSLQASSTRIVSGPRTSASKYDKNLNRRPQDVSLNAFAFLFSEIIQYMQKQSSGIQDLEKRLSQIGYHMGQRALELVTIREGKTAHRETKILGILQFIHTTIWKAVFGRPADALEKSNDSNNEYMIIDFNPVISQFISVPKEKSQLNCAALAAGIIEAVLDGSLFTAEVSTHTVETEQYPNRTVFLVKFDDLVIDREDA